MTEDRKWLASIVEIRYIPRIWGRRFEMKKLLVATAIASLVMVAPAFASNMGFKLTRGLVQNAGTSGENWVSIPFYWGTGTPTAAALCTDVGAGVQEVGIKSPATDLYTSRTCPITMGTGFAFNAGDAVYVKATNGTNWVIVGAHNPSLQFSFVQNAGTSGENWISIPYHYSPAMTAAAICADIGVNAQEVGVKSPATDLYTSRTCPITMGTGFAFSAGDALYVKAANGTTWIPDHF